MRLLTSFVLLCISATQAQLSNNEEYKENLKLSHLSDGKLLAHFEFKTKINRVKTMPRKKTKRKIKQYELTPSPIFSCRLWAISKSYWSSA